MRRVVDAVVSGLVLAGGAVLATHVPEQNATGVLLLTAMLCLIVASGVYRTE